MFINKGWRVIQKQHRAHLKVNMYPFTPVQADINFRETTIDFGAAIFDVQHSLFSSLAFLK